MRVLMLSEQLFNIIGQTINLVRMNAIVRYGNTDCMCAWFCALDNALRNIFACVNFYC